MVGTGKYTRPQSRLGSYEIIRPLARGGMAELFVARAVGLEGFEKVVVLKRVLPHYAENPRFVRSFLDEAKLVAGFDHPNIAHVYDMGMADGSYFFTMELVHGIDLRTILKRCARNATQVPIALAVLIARNIASALHYAHERRSADGELLDVVHRDVSPSNIIVSFDGVPKLIDFGIAKATSSTIKTQTGALKGKIAYMSPEQAKGSAIDRRTDIFALGIVLWEMIAGRRLYKSENDMATIQRIIYEPPPSPRTVRPDCSPELERIVMRALALDLRARYQTAQQLELDLEELATEHRLKQSTIELGAFVQVLFPDERLASTSELASTPTVTDAAPVGDAGPPVRERGDDEDDEILPAPWPSPSLVPTQTFEAPTVPDRVPRAARPLAPPRRRTRWIWAALGVVVLGGGAAIAIGLPGDDLPSAAAIVTPPAPVAAEPEASPPPPTPTPTTSPPPEPPPPTIEAAVEPPARAPAKKKPARRTDKPVATKKPKSPDALPRPDKPKKPPEKPEKTDKPWDPNSVFPPSP
ncbi:MAG TPA: serine/threonine-protein kinase [Kofleriaceae bacterium]|nr:serine/threonine-protein kinase [Kofleriaceae bacterium]